MILRHKNCTKDLLLKSDSDGESFLDYLELNLSLKRQLADYVNKIFENEASYFILHEEDQDESEIVEQLKDVKFADVKKMSD